MKRDLRFEWTYPNTPEEVWECLTTAELIEQWLMTNDFKPVVGHRFQFTARPMPGWSGIVDCQVLEVVPHRRLSYSWVSGPTPGSDNIKTTVTWTLVPEKDQTRLILEHTGFSGFRAWMTSFLLGSGWKSKIASAFSEVLKRRSAA